MRRPYRAQHLLNHSILYSASRPNTSTQKNQLGIHVKNAAFWSHAHRPCYNGFRVKPRDLNFGRNFPAHADSPWATF